NETLAIKLREVRLGDNRAIVTVAKFQKEDIPKITYTRQPEKRNVEEIQHAEQAKEWRLRDSTSFKEMVTGESSGKVEDVNIHLPNDPPLVSNAWCKCSLLGSTWDLLRLASLEELLTAVGMDTVSLRYVGGLRVLITFPTVELAQQFLIGREEDWKVWFSSLVTWDGQDIEFLRVAWIKISGVPVYLWNSNVFSTIEGKAGMVIHGPSASSNDVNLASQKVAVLVSHGRRIEDCLNVICQGRLFKVWITEVDEEWVPDFVTSETNRIRLLKPNSGGSISSEQPQSDRIWNADNIDEANAGASSVIQVTVGMAGKELHGEGNQVAPVEVADQVTPADDTVEDEPMLEVYGPEVDQEAPPGDVHGTLHVSNIISTPEDNSFMGVAATHRTFLNMDGGPNATLDLNQVDKSQDNNNNNIEAPVENNDESSSSSEEEEEKVSVRVCVYSRRRMDYIEVIAVEDQDDEEYQDPQEEEEEEEEETDTEDDDYNDDAELIHPVATSPRVPGTGNSQAESNDKNLSKGKLYSQEDDDVWNLEIEGLNCPICTEPWTTAGEHHICCLPCGHIYGLSCIKKWIQQHGRSGKCPQCNKKCTLKDVRVLYAEQLCVVDAELLKQVQSLEAKCAFLKQKVVQRYNLPEACLRIVVFSVLA
ncbi:hypothetical protein M8C21_018310, partial [Ambrosia artemisiifolia]